MRDRSRLLPIRCVSVDPFLSFYFPHNIFRIIKYFPHNYVLSICNFILISTCLCFLFGTSYLLIIIGLPRITSNGWSCLICGPNQILFDSRPEKICFCIYTNTVTAQLSAFLFLLHTELMQFPYFLNQNYQAS